MKMNKTFQNSCVYNNSTVTTISFISYFVSVILYSFPKRPHPATLHKLYASQKPRSALAIDLLNSPMVLIFSQQNKLLKHTTW